MSYLQIHFWPGGTEEQYRAVLKAVHPASGQSDQLPTGRQHGHVSSFS